MFDKKMFLTHLKTIDGKADGNRINLQEDDKGQYAKEAIRATQKTGKQMVLGKDGKLYPLGADPTRAQPGSPLYSKKETKKPQSKSSDLPVDEYGYADPSKIRPIPMMPPPPPPPPETHPSELYKEPVPDYTNQYIKMGKGPMAYWRRREDFDQYGNVLSGYSQSRSKAYKSGGESQKMYDEDVIRRTIEAARLADIEVNKQIEKEMKDEREPIMRVRPVMADTWIQPEDGLGGPIKVRRLKQTPFSEPYDDVENVRVRSADERTRARKGRYLEPRSTFAPKMTDDEGRPVSTLPQTKGKEGIPHDPRYVDPRELFPNEFTGPFDRPRSQIIKPELPYSERMGNKVGFEGRAGEENLAQLLYGQRPRTRA